jgi:hypothetical protein
MNEDDPYADLKRHALTAKVATILERRIEPLKMRRRRKQFILVPWTWVERLRDARHVSTYKVALHILHLSWKKNGQPFTLANGALAEDGISRYQKRDALEELERLGLIRVERRVRKSPEITALP